MKKLNTYIAGIASCLLLAGTTSCSDFLEEKPMSNFTQDNYFQNITQAQTAVDGTYECLRTLVAQDGYGESPWVTLELLCGHSTTLGQSTYNNTYIRHTAGTLNPSFKNIWEGFYEGIANCNMALKGMEKLHTDEIKPLQGEVYALRALYYFYLTKLYGDIPLITTPVTSDSKLLYPERSSQEAVFNQIIDDLKLAENAGIPDTDETGRVSLGFVKTLLADVYQYMAGEPLKKGAEYYKLAYQKAKEVLDQSYWTSPNSPDYTPSKVSGSRYSLFDSYGKLHDKENKNKGELIFQIQYSATADATNSLTSMIVPESKPITKVYDKFGALQPTWNFYNSYESGDKRIQEQEMFFTKYANYQDASKTETFSSPALFKYFDVDAVSSGNCDLNFTLYRLPEVMLIYAESYTQANGNPDNLSYQLINAIRERAELAPLSGLSKEDFLQAVWKERSHELCYENKEYFDIQRTHMVYNLSANKFEAFDKVTNESGIIFNTKYLLWPLPSTEIDANPQLLPNNTGW